MQLVPADLSALAADLGVGLAAAAALFTLLWVVSLVRRDASLVDPFWGPGFLVAALAYAAVSEGAGARRLLVLVLVAVWAVRLGGYLLWRNWGKEEDYRYRAMRAKWGERFPWVSLVTVFWLQALLLWVVSWPLCQALRSPAPPDLGWLDALGVAFVAIGLFFETVGDLQLARFKARRQDDSEVMDRGLWRYTRHPNYFGDFMVWWGFGLIALATPGAWWTLTGPLVMSFLLLKVSGVALLEEDLRDKKPAYRAYAEKTNAFFPWFPSR